MLLNHTSVLLKECIEALNIKAEGVYVDGTLGGAGHSLAISQGLNEKGTLIGIDRDPYALKRAGEKLSSAVCQVKLIEDNYSNIKGVLDHFSIPAIDGALLDIGVSSFQLDDESRGFSYNKEADLDMRMSDSDKLTAKKVVNTYRQSDLEWVIKTYGEERWAKRIAAFIVDKRKEKPIETTFELVSVIKAAIPLGARKDGPHPAKRTFQAIRIEVNGELDHLEKAVKAFSEVLAVGGRLAIISFHSLEDRIIKQAFNQLTQACTCPQGTPICVCGGIAAFKKISRKPILPTEEEVLENPRSRSAKLRVIEKI